MVAFVISIIALAVAMMAFPAVSQMIWGRPNIRWNFDVEEINGARVLQYLILNLSITNKLWQKFSNNNTEMPEIIPPLDLNLFVINNY